MIKPPELDSDRPHGRYACRGRDIWDALSAAADGNAAVLRRVLARDPNLYRAEYWYAPPLYFAVREGHLEAVRILLDAGADPSYVGLGGEDLVTTARDRGHEEVAQTIESAKSRGRAAERPDTAQAEKGAALHRAAQAGDDAEVERLLAEGADPNFVVDSSGSATFIARTPELRARLESYGGRLDAYDLVFLGLDDEAVARVAADPREADAGCGGVLAAACTLGKRELFERLLAAGARVPPMLTPCRSYLLGDPGMLGLLLASGMNPDLPNWQHATPLHDLCMRDYRGRALAHRQEAAAILLDAGAAISARDDDYRSTPLGWAARTGLGDMVELLLERSAPTNRDDDPPWATPLAWAKRRGHADIASILERAGARA